MNTDPSERDRRRMAPTSHGRARKWAESVKVAGGPTVGDREKVEKFVANEIAEITKAVKLGFLTKLEGDRGVRVWEAWANLGPECAGVLSRRRETT